MSDLPTYRLTRRFAAPRALVWRVWTEPELLARWYGPGVETIIHEFDLRPGGVWRNEMRMRGMSMFSLMRFTEVVPEQRMVWDHGSADENWAIASNPMMPDWPRLLHTVVAFDDVDGATDVTLTQVPIEASAAEIACFAAKMDGMSSGWGAGYAVVDEILAELAG